MKLPDRLGNFRVHMHSKMEQEMKDNVQLTVLATIMCHMNESTRMIGKRKLSDGSNIQFEERT